MRRRMVTGGVVAALGLAIASPVFSQEAISDAQNKLLARRAAEADCYRKLAESVYGLKLNSETYVRDFVTESDEIRTSVDTFVRGVRLGQPRYYDDGVCEVDAEVSVAKLITELKQIHQTHYKGNTVTTVDIENVKEYLKTDVIRVTGSGAPRPDLPPGLPEGIEAVITPLPSNTIPMLHVPPLWQSVGPQGRLMAQRAAELDAMRKLLEQIQGLRLNSTTLVRDFITESDEISTRAEGIVVGAAVVTKYFHADELIAEVTMEVPVEKVITRIKELHAAHYHGNKVTTTDVENIKKTIKREMIRATGSGVPPPRFLKETAGPAGDSPAWLGERIEAVGEGTDPEIASPQGKLRARRAAELDGMRKIAEQINGLRIQSGTTVRDFVTQHDEIATQVQAVLAGAVVDPPEYGGDIARVKVSLPASEVWSVIHQHMVIVKRRG